jgi:hypothetical protein
LAVYILWVVPNKMVVCVIDWKSKMATIRRNNLT